MTPTRDDSIIIPADNEGRRTAPALEAPPGHLTPSRAEATTDEARP